MKKKKLDESLKEFTIWHPEGNEYEMYALPKKDYEKFRKLMRKYENQKWKIPDSEIFRFYPVGKVNEVEEYEIIGITDEKFVEIPIKNMRQLLIIYSPE